MYEWYERGNYGQEMTDQFCLHWQLPRQCRDFLHATNLWHQTKGFTSPPKEGMLRIFRPEKSRRLQLGSNPQTWVPEASMLTTRPPKPLLFSCNLFCHSSCSCFGHMLPIIRRYSLCIYSNWYTLYVRLTGYWPGQCGTGGIHCNNFYVYGGIMAILTRPADSQLKHATRFNCCIYTVVKWLTDASRN
jgi:hypothetical protein